MTKQRDPFSEPGTFGQEELEEMGNQRQRNEDRERKKLINRFKSLDKSNQITIVFSLAALGVAIFGLILPHIITGPLPHTYFKDDSLERLYDENIEWFNLTLGNEGNSYSKNVVFEALFPDWIFIEEDDSNWGRTPDESSIEKHYMKLKWNTIPANWEFKISLYLSFRGRQPSEPNGFGFPSAITLYADDEEAPIYDFYKDTFHFDPSV